MNGVKIGKLENRRVPKLTRKGKIRTKRNCASQSCRASQDAIMRNTRYWQASDALMTSQEQNCRGMKYAKLVNKSRHVCVTSECMRKSMNVKPLHNTSSLQSTRSGWVDTDEALEGEPHANIVGREFKSDDRPDLYARSPPLETFRRVTCIFSCKGSETCQWKTEWAPTLETLVC